MQKHSSEKNLVLRYPVNRRIQLEVKIFTYVVVAVVVTMKPLAIMVLTTVASPRSPMSRGIHLPETVVGIITVTNDERSIVVGIKEVRSIVVGTTVVMKDVVVELTFLSGSS